MDVAGMFRSCLESCSAGSDVSLEVLRNKLGMSRLLFNHVESVFRNEASSEPKSSVCISDLLPLLERLLDEKNNLPGNFFLF